jgi:hypothetical protein
MLRSYNRISRLARLIHTSSPQVIVPKDKWKSLLPYRNRRAYDLFVKSNPTNAKHGDWIIVQDEMVHIVGKKSKLLTLIGDHRVGSNDFVTRLGKEEDPVDRSLTLPTDLSKGEALLNDMNIGCERGQLIMRYHPHELCQIKKVEFQPQFFLLRTNNDTCRPVMSMFYQTVEMIPTGYGIPISFIVDTGSPGTFLHYNILQEHVDAHPWLGKTNVRGAHTFFLNGLPAVAGDAGNDLRLDGINLLGLDVIMQHGLFIPPTKTEEFNLHYNNLHCVECNFPKETISPLATINRYPR